MRIIDRIRKAVAADDESETEGDGYLSTRAEWHAAAWGFCAAFLAAFTGDPYLFIVSTGWLVTRNESIGREIAKEAVYVAGHAVPGFVLGSGAALAYSVIPV